MYLVFPNKVSDRRVRHHQFDGKTPSFSAFLGEQLLRKDTFEHKGKLDPYLLLLVRREDIDDTVYRLNGGVRMEGCQSQMACFRHGQGRFDRFEVSHFSDQHYIRVLPEHVSKGGLERHSVGVDLPLVDQALFVAVEIFYGVLDCDDMVVSFRVYPVDHGSQGSGLSASCGSRYKYEPPRFFHEIIDDLGQPEVLEGLYLKRDGPESPCHSPPLHEYIPPEPAEALHAEREVQLVVFFELVLLCVRQDAVT